MTAQSLSELVPPPIPDHVDNGLKQLLAGKTKPPGSLGRLEDLAWTLGRIQQRLDPVADRCTLLVFAADHGLADAGVSAYPKTVTRQMVLNMLAGGAASQVLARASGVSVQVINAGIEGPALAHPDLIDRALGPGTADSRYQPAMSEHQTHAALWAGSALAAAAPGEAIALGEMGIGNSAAAALVAGKCLDHRPEDLVGPGSGMFGGALVHKREIVRQAAKRTAPKLPPLTALSEYGGFEIAMMAGAFLGAARTRRAAIVDGFIATTAALVATQTAPTLRDYLLFAHRSAEPGHQCLLEALKARPLLDLELRLGEGTGAILAWPLVRSAVAMLADMASFESAGVSGPRT